MNIAGNQESHRELYGYARERLEEEYDRFFRMEEKAARYVPVLTLLLGGVVFLGQWVCGKFSPPVTFSQLIPVVITAGALLAQVTGWISVLGTFRMHLIPRQPLNDEIIALFSEHDLGDTYYTLAWLMRDLLDAMKEINDRKARKLHGVYLSVWTAAGLLGLTAMVYAFHASLYD